MRQAPPALERAAPNSYLAAPLARAVAPLRKAAREAKNESLAKWLTVHIIFEKKMRKTTKQADLIGLWLERDAALEDPVEWVRLRARARGRSGS